MFSIDLLTQDPPKAEQECLFDSDLLDFQPLEDLGWHNEAIVLTMVAIYQLPVSKLYQCFKTSFHFTIFLIFSNVLLRWQL